MEKNKIYGFQFIVMHLLTKKNMCCKKWTSYTISGKTNWLLLRLRNTYSHAHQNKLTPQKTHMQLHNQLAKTRY